ncbi:MAG: histidine phosphatase family protein [Candidatus Diapherotrites archaeon]
MKIFLVRHGETKMNLERRLLGKIDSPLVQEGLAHAERLGDYLKGKEIDLAFSSTLGRVVKTTEIISEKTGLVFERRHDLDEISYGILEGLTRKEADEKYPRIWETRLKDRFNFDLEGAEDYSDVGKRMRPFVDELKEKYPSKTILIAGHFNTHRVLIGILLGLSHEEIVEIDVPHRIVYEIEINEESNVKYHSIDSGEEKEGLVYL